MAGFKVDFKQLKSQFFDASKVRDDADRKHAKVQAKFGAFVRRRMKSSLRYRKKPSAPGQPPSARRDPRYGGKSPLRELIFFSRDPATNSVVIGPLAFGTRRAGTLEKGGPATVRAGRGRTKTVTIRPRPFVKPAGDAEAKNFPELLRSVVK